ncbi:hypothetical protein TrVE_jg5054, partial [Triparma verrucosa]
MDKPALSSVVPHEEGDFDSMTPQELKAELLKQKQHAQRANRDMLRERDAALRERDAALRERDAALRREADAVEEERKKFSAVISQIKEGNAGTKSGPTKPLDRNTPGVRKAGPNVLSENTTINNCRTNVTIHKETEAFLESLLGDQTKTGKMLYQKTVEKGVFYWSFMVNNTKSCDLLMRMRVVRQDEDGLELRVESVDEEEVQVSSLPNPHSTATKKLRLLLKEGRIILQPLP